MFACIAALFSHARCVNEILVYSVQLKLQWVVPQ